MENFPTGYSSTQPAFQLAVDTYEIKKRYGDMLAKTRTDCRRDYIGHSRLKEESKNRQLFRQSQLAIN
jgi:hypothetical protein